MKLEELPERAGVCIVIGGIVTTAVAGVMGIRGILMLLDYLHIKITFMMCFYTFLFLVGPGLLMLGGFFAWVAIREERRDKVLMAMGQAPLDPKRLDTWKKAQKEVAYQQAVAAARSAQATPKQIYAAQMATANRGLK